MKNLIYVIVVLLSLLLSSLTSSCSARTDDEVQISKKDNGTTIEIYAGQQIFLTLDSNPTTGYSWHVLENNETVLQQIGDPVYIQDPSGEQIVGAGGTETFMFEALAVGEVLLSLGYARSWEEREPAIEYFNITIIVH